MENLLAVNDLSVTLDNHTLLDHINFELHPNETLVVIGPNGAGKTTLFRALLGMIAYRGVINWKPGVKIGYVPQRLYIDADLPITTLEFFRLKQVSGDETRRVLAAVGFSDDQTDESRSPKIILKTKLGVLSGGQLQRVLIAWALTAHPDVLLFDEPTTGIDLSAEETIYELLHKLQVQEKLAIILISHEMHIVSRYANLVLCLNKEQVCYGPPKDILQKENLESVFGTNIGVYHHQH
jgi:zinc transport system ATP-binding protein